MAPAHAIDGPDAHDHATKQLAPELTIDGPQQDGYSPRTRVTSSSGISPPMLLTPAGSPISPMCRRGVVSSMSLS